jgi:hypothetical protein
MSSHLTAGQATRMSRWMAAPSSLSSPPSHSYSPYMVLFGCVLVYHTRVHAADLYMACTQNKSTHDACAPSDKV